MTHTINKLTYFEKCVEFWKIANMSKVTKCMFRV